MNKIIYHCGQDFYAAPACEILEISIQGSSLETSFTSGSIESGELEDWGTL